MMVSMKVADLGEFGLIDRINDLVGQPLSSELIIGIGDDTAAWQTEDGTVLLASVDSLVADVHFLDGKASWSDLGWRAAATGISDIAAMGGIPDFVLVNLSVPTDLSVTAIDNLYAGLLEAGEIYGVSVAGGNIVRSEKSIITTTILGHGQKSVDGEPLLLRRDRARCGQSIAVTGKLGDAAAGLDLLQKGASVEHPLVQAHLHPQPPLALAQEAVRLGIDCGIDISDGLLHDLSRICQRSSGHNGAVVTAGLLPLSADLMKSCPEKELAMAINGGEDYELILVAPASKFDELRDAGVSDFTVIGLIEEDPGRRVRILDEAGEEILSGAAAWDHLSSQGGVEI